MTILPEQTTDTDVKPSTLEEFQDLSYTERFIWFLSLLMIISAFAVFVRPDNPIARNLASHYGVTATFEAFVLFVSGLLIPLAYKLKGDLNLVTLLCTPSILWFVALTRQIGASETAPIMHIVTSGGLICAIALLFSFTRRLDKLETENQALYEKIEGIGD